jgi:hypothetical protein
MSKTELTELNTSLLQKKDIELFEAYLLVSKRFYVITIDNSVENSHNINIDYPTYTVRALNKAEAIGLLYMDENFRYRNKPIVKIEELEN